MLASIRSQTGGAAALYCRGGRDAVALLTVSKPGKMENRSTSSEETRLMIYLSVTLCLGGVAWCSCFPCAQAPCPKLACQARARTAKLEDFALNLRPSSFRVYSRAPSCPARSASNNNEVQSRPRCRCIFPRTVRIRLYRFRGVHVARSTQVTTPKTRLSRTALQSPSSASASERSRRKVIAGRMRDYVDPLRSG